MCFLGNGIKGKEAFFLSTFLLLCDFFFFKEKTQTSAFICVISKAIPFLQEEKNRAL